MYSFQKTATSVTLLVETVPYSMQHSSAGRTMNKRTRVQILLPYNIAYFSVHSLANLLYLIEQVHLALIITIRKL